MKIVALDRTSNNKVNVSDTKNLIGENLWYICPIHKTLGKDVKMHRVDRNGTLFFRYANKKEVDRLASGEFGIKTSNGGESFLHLFVKNEFARLWINDSRKDVEVEKVFYDKGKVLRIADIYGVTRYGQKQVKEIQISNISLENLIARTRDYENIFGIDDVIWVLNKNISNFHELTEWLLSNNYKFGELEAREEKKLVGEVVFQFDSSPHS